MNYLQIYEKSIDCTINELAKDVKGLAKEVVSSSMVTYRVKDPISLKRKMLHKKTADIFLIKDIYGIRILVDEVEDVYKVLNYISSKIVGYVKNDYIANPKIREGAAELKGKKIRFIQYIAVKNSTLYEIQITTREFHRQNEKLHRVYKKYKYGS